MISTQQLDDLFKKFYAVKDPDLRDENVVECIDSWLKTHSITKENLYQKLVSIVADQQKYACILGFCYQYAIGTLEEPKQACKYYEIASIPDDRFARNQLGWCYQYSYGTPFDGDKAFYWLLKSASAGDVNGKLNLALCYQRGVGTTKDSRKAYLWICDAAKNGLPNKKCYVGTNLANGWGVNQDVHAALRCLVKSGPQIGSFNATRLFQGPYN